MDGFDSFSSDLVNHDHQFSNLRFFSDLQMSDRGEWKRIKKCQESYT